MLLEKIPGQKAQRIRILKKLFPEINDKINTDWESTWKKVIDEDQKKVDLFITELYKVFSTNKRIVLLFVEDLFNKEHGPILPLVSSFVFFREN
jgi:hypothetical protein